MEYVNSEVDVDDVTPADRYLDQPKRAKIITTAAEEHQRLMMIV